MQLLRLKQVISATGLSRMTIYRLEKRGGFPARRQLSPNTVAWLQDEISEWLRNRPVVRPARLSSADDVHLNQHR